MAPALNAPTVVVPEETVRPFCAVTNPAAVMALEIVALPATEISFWAVTCPATVRPDCAVTRPDAVTVLAVVAPALNAPTEVVPDDTVRPFWAVIRPDAVNAATEESPVTVRPAFAVTKPDAVTAFERTVFPATETSFWADICPDTVRPDCAVTRPDAVMAAVLVTPVAVNAPTVV